MTKEGYFKKIIPPKSDKAKTDELTFKEGDSLLCAFDVANDYDLLFFSDAGNVYKSKIDDFDAVKPSALGDYIPVKLGFAANEKVVMMIPTKDYKGEVAIFFESGKAVSIPMSAYETKTNRKKLINGYSSKAKLVRMAKLDEESDFILMRNSDKATLLHTELIPSSATKNATGVQVFTLKKNSTVSNVYTKEEFQTEDHEYYRTKKIPTTGHFIQEKDKAANSLPGQISLE